MTKLTLRSIKVSALLLLCIICDEERQPYKSKRTRKSVAKIKQAMGDVMFRRAFRINYDSFCSSYSTIKTNLCIYCRHQMYIRSYIHDPLLDSATKVSNAFQHNLHTSCHFHSNSYLKA